MDQKVLSLYALRCARGDVMKNAFFPKLLSDLYIYTSVTKAIAGLQIRALLQLLWMSFTIDSILVTINNYSNLLLINVFNHA